MEEGTSLLIYAVTAAVIVTTMGILLFHEFSMHDGSVLHSALAVLSMGLLAFCSWHQVRAHRRRLAACENKAQTALARAKRINNDYISVLDNLPAAVMAIGRRFEILQANERVAGLHGIAAADAIGRKCYDLFGNGGVCDNCPVAKAMATKEVQKNLKRELSKSGRDIYIEQTVIPILRENGEVRYVLEIGFDATKRVRLEHANRDMFMQTVGALANLIDRRDTATGRHSAGVSEIARGIGRELGVAPDTLEEIAVAALLHDIGKIGIPESILSKPGRLTPEEYAVVQNHCEIGYNALKGIKPLAGVAEYLLYHHERYDGQGYPAKKHGEEIPLISSILSVADVFEAITADRVYRPAMSLEEALAVMAAGRGTAFDPVVLDAFFAYIRRREANAGAIIDRLAGNEG